MFFDNPIENRNRYKPKTVRSSSNLKQAILYGIIGVLCLLRIRQLWLFAIIFFACMGVSIWLYIRHKRKEEKLDDIINGFAEEDDDTDRSELLQRADMTKMSSKDRKQRKQEYGQFLENLEHELGDFDEDDEYDEDEVDE